MRGAEGDSGGLLAWWLLAQFTALRMLGDEAAHLLSDELANITGCGCSTPAQISIRIKASKSLRKHKTLIQEQRGALGPKVRAMMDASIIQCCLLYIDALGLFTLRTSKSISFFGETGSTVWTMLTCCHGNSPEPSNISSIHETRDNHGQLKTVSVLLLQLSANARRRCRNRS